MILSGASSASLRSRVMRPLAGRDPGRGRLTTAVAVSCGVLASALFALFAIHVLHAPPGFLAMATFLSVQAGSAIKDRSAVKRAVTAAMLIPSVLIAVLAAWVLSPWRPAVIAVFVVLTGLVVWVRRFGPRAAAVGAAGFFAYFFTLFMRPTGVELPVYCMLVGGAVATQCVVRLVLLAKRPRRELNVMLHELRSASEAALQSAFADGKAGTLRARLARVDEIGRAITTWQQEFQTDRFLACDEQSFAERVLDARITIEEVCGELVARHAATAITPEQRSAAGQLGLSLSQHASPAEIAEAVLWAEHTLASAGTEGTANSAVILIAQAVVAQDALRQSGRSEAQPLSSAVNSAAKPPPPPSAPDLAAGHPHQANGKKKKRLEWVPWRNWAPTSRMAVQAMAAALIATVAGEAISASRWYWAVLTAFVVFVGTTTRSDILTRAYRRVIGTVAGIVVGVIAVLVVGHDPNMLILICVLSVFGMLYFGAISYAYSSFFMVVMLVAIYSMLGVLNGTLLELRVSETVTGAVIGVLCAYLIFSANSHPALMAKVNAYFDALDQLLQLCRAALDQPEQRRAALTALQRIENAQVSVEQTVSAMSTAFFFGRRDQVSSAVHLMYVASRAAARFVQSAIAEASAADVLSVKDANIPAAVDETRHSLNRARSSLNAPDSFPAAPATTGVDLALAPHSAQATAELQALSRIDWAMRRVIDLASGSKSVSLSSDDSS
ncbi:FUSC family protein [Leucobacter viscericola]|uniref:FUSC family protein n=1 Tax=Leucobacter viscericola TaxID=2714935 RepID=A0A6G7XI07_9MICO|nr:FUSC family protein [Leucobacter viscericola]QIK64183.1 FUSC family protein [Leucobacter viscericola]